MSWAVIREIEDLKRKKKNADVTIDSITRISSSKKSKKYRKKQETRIHNLKRIYDKWDKEIFSKESANQKGGEPEH